MLPHNGQYMVHYVSAMMISGLTPHDQPLGHLVRISPAFCPQTALSVPILPTVPTANDCVFYNLRFDAYYGMEEVVGPK